MGKKKAKIEIKDNLLALLKESSILSFDNYDASKENGNVFADNVILMFETLGFKLKKASKKLKKIKKAE